MMQSLYFPIMFTATWLVVGWGFFFYVKRERRLGRAAAVSQEATGSPEPEAAPVVPAVDSGRASIIVGEQAAMLVERTISGVSLVMYHHGLRAGDTPVPAMQHVIPASVRISRVRSSAVAMRQAQAMRRFVSSAPKPPPN